MQSQKVAEHTSLLPVVKQGLLLPATWPLGQLKALQLESGCCLMVAWESDERDMLGHQ